MSKRIRNTRHIKEIGDVRYIGIGKSVHWEFNKDSGDKH